MKRWNGWGNVNTAYPLPAAGATYLSEKLGQGHPRPDATFEQIVARLPISRLPENSLLTTDPAQRLRHARGQSLPDWIALRSGQIDNFPDGIAYPRSGQEVRVLMDFARDTGACVIPYGGGSSVTGHINPLPGDQPILTLDLARLNELLDMDETSHLATFGAGISGQDLEAELGRHGFTLGHFPQSFEYSTLGGWIATRSSGQQSYHYGRIEDLFAGGLVETPAGELKMPPLPASAAGPDLRHFILGSEGRFGIITQATMRVRRRPQREGFYAAFFRDWLSGVSAVREIAQAGIAISMLRLSDAQETETTLALAGRERLMAWADRGLHFLHYGPERCLLIYGVTGNQAGVARARQQTKAIARSYGGLPVGNMIGETWRKSRFLAPYLRNTLWERGYALDTLETAVSWSKVLEMAAAVKAAIRETMELFGEQVLVFAHLSHVYVDGASIYVTYLFRRAADPDQTLDHWRHMKNAASQVIIAHGGTISHQHGVGIDHAPYLEAEKGKIGIDWLEAARRAIDPDEMLNPGKLLMKDGDQKCAGVEGRFRFPNETKG